MPPFKPLQRAPRFLAGWTRRTRPTLPESAGTGHAITGRGGLGIGGLLLIAVLSFALVLAGATVLSVLQGGPLTQAGPADRQGPRRPEARAGARPPPGGGPEGDAAVSPAAAHEPSCLGA